MKFMASNGLSANPEKTAFIFLNSTFNPMNLISIKIGKEEVFEVLNAKLLGMTFENNQKWNEHIYANLANL